jgi:hypothetical protein
MSGFFGAPLAQSPQIPGAGALLLQPSAMSRHASTGTGNTTNGNWLGMIFASPVPVWAMRLGFKSVFNTTTTNIAAAYIQPIEDPTVAQPFVGLLSDGSSARGAGGNQNVTFNGAGADIAYPSASGAVTTLAIAPGTGATSNDQQCLFQYSDWYYAVGSAGGVGGVGAKPYPSTIGDGMYYYGVIVGAGVNGLQGPAEAQAGNWQAYVLSPLVANAKTIRLYQIVANNSGPVAFTTWASFGSLRAGTQGGVFALNSIDFMTAARVLNVCCIGDSQSEGWDSGAGANRPTSDLLGGVRRACFALSTAGLPVIYNDCTWPGIDYDALLKTFAPSLTNSAAGSGVLASTGLVEPVYRPDILVMPWASANDNAAAPNNATLQDHFNKTDEVQRWCERIGIVCIVATVPPASGRYGTAGANQTLTPESVRQTFNTQLRNRAAANPNFLLLDTDAVVSAGGYPATIKAGFAQTDGIHFTDAGNAAVGAAAQRLIAPYVQKL